VLTGKDVHKDMKEYLDLKRVIDERSIDSFVRYCILGVFKGIRLLLRLALQIRLNQARIMEFIGLESIENKRINEKKQ